MGELPVRRIVVDFFEKEKWWRRARRKVTEYGSSEDIRYGENWHQKARILRRKGKRFCIANAKQLHGKRMSFNNYVDAEAAFNAVEESMAVSLEPCVAVIKHTNPCGYATGETIEEAFERAWQGDPTSAFGSVIALNEEMNAETAARTTDKFIEVIIAEGFTNDALDILKKKKNLRLLDISCYPPFEMRRYESKDITGAVLFQETDTQLFLPEKFFHPRTGIDDLYETAHKVDEGTEDEKTIGIVTKTQPTASRELYEFAWLTEKIIKSNAIAICREYRRDSIGGRYHQLLGMGAGQPNRVVSVELAIRKAEENLRQENYENDGMAAKIREIIKKPNMTRDEYVEHLRNHDEAMYNAFVEGEEQHLKEQLGGCVLASDSFFPFPDSIELAAEDNIRNIIQPGGSINDKLVIGACNKNGVAMIFTGIRHFRH